MTDIRRYIIRGLSTLSALGVQDAAPHALWQAGMLLSEAPVSTIETHGREAAVFALRDDAQRMVQGVLSENRYQRLDRTTHLAIAAARGTFSRLGSHELDSVEAVLKGLGCISIGSSRGPTLALEQSLRRFASDGRVASLTSPTTTAGNISSWVAQEYLGAAYSVDAAARNGSEKIAALTTSMTCSSALHSLLVAKSFVASGMADKALFGGSEACLTPYTIAQLEALRIYGNTDSAWPSRPLDSAARENCVVLGEAAGTALLVIANDNSELRLGDLELLGIGWALESIPSPTGISEDGAAFECAMKMALSSLNNQVKIGAVVAHAPGTRCGDEAEKLAIQRVFGEVLTVSTKHLTGHTYGASGMLSLSLADALLDGAVWRGFPYSDNRDRGGTPELAPISLGSAVVINSAGFGGNAISMIVGRPQGIAVLPLPKPSLIHF